MLITEEEGSASTSSLNAQKCRALRQGTWRGLGMESVASSVCSRELEIACESPNGDAKEAGDTCNWHSEHTRIRPREIRF